MAISPGVYTKITDLSTYVAQIPGTIGCVCALTKKGEDNVFRFLSSQRELLSEFGDPNIEDYGKNFSQGPYIAYNFLGESGSMYFMRCMPEDASFANIRIDVQLAASELTPTLGLTYIQSTDANTKLKLQSKLETDGDIKPLCILHPIGRGEYYNSYAIRITQVANPMYTGVYDLDIYEIQSNGSEVIIESFEVSFNPTAKDKTGSSIFIEDVLYKYSNILRALTTKANGDYTDGYNLMIKQYDKNIGVVTCDSTSADIVDTKQDFSDWDSPLSGMSNYTIIAKDDRGNEIYGWLGDLDTSVYENGEKIKVYSSRNLASASQGWLGSTSDFNFDSNDITYEIRECYATVESLFTSTEAVPLKKGIDGAIVNSNGVVDPTACENLLISAYSGLLPSPSLEGGYVDDIIDNEFIYYSMIFDAGYPRNVKIAIGALAVSRGDCIAIMDNGDNPTPAAALTKRQEENTFNNYHTALFEPFNKVNDIFTGRDIWVSPVFHMSYILPRNDRLTEIWFAAAGFDFVIDSIKELRYSPKEGNRDQFYMKQLNPLVKFREGIVPFGQLTTQSKPSAMQDINIVRLVLYAKVALERYCRYFIFKQNDSITWDSVSRDITQFLGNLQKRRGLYSFGLEVGATEYEKKQKKFHVNVILNPTRVSEKIDLNFFIK